MNKPSHLERRNESPLRVEFSESFKLVKFAYFKMRPGFLSKISYARMSKSNLLIFIVIENFLSSRLSGSIEIKSAILCSIVCLRQ